jgi:hypothetical protein
MEVTRKSVIGNFALGGLAAGIGAATSTKGLIIGGAVELGALLTVSGEVLQKFTSGASGQSSVKGIVDAADAFAQVYRDLVPQRFFYEELWNAAGSACPANIPIPGLTSFGGVDIDYRDSKRLEFYSGQSENAKPATGAKTSQSSREAPPATK